MKTQLVSALVVTLLVACAAPDQAPTPSTEVTPAKVATDVPQASAASAKVERAERLLATGGDATEAKSLADSVVADASATVSERTEAMLQQSRALELLGDKEGAIRAVEALLASRAGTRSLPVDVAADKQLRRLVTGTAEAPTPVKLSDDPTVAPIASVLAKYFPLQDGVRADVLIGRVGGSDATSQRLGTFEISGAIHAAHASACPLCADDLDVHTGVHGSDGFPAIPRLRTTLDKGLAVFYADLGQNRIPARYEAQLPMTVAELEAHLQKGEGVIAVRERDGAPPAILLAAPRTAQLDEVEEAFAAMKALPKEAVVVPVKNTLAPQEIKPVVRAALSALKGCYETFLVGSPTAAGRLTLGFAIDGAGATKDVQVTSDFGDDTLRACMTKITTELHFPANGQTGVTTVKYPLSFSP